jgi:hypothetical protein
MLRLIILVKPPSKVNRSYMVERVDRLSERYALTALKGRYLAAGPQELRQRVEDNAFQLRIASSVTAADRKANLQRPPREYAREEDWSWIIDPFADVHWR